MDSSATKILETKTNFASRFVPDHAELKQLVEQFKKEGLKVVLTQGVYDLLHEGHALYLEVAKSYGDILIVGVDSDELTRMRKGPNRPIVPQEERIKMLIHLRHVDVVTLREADQDIGELIRLIQPDTLVTSTSTEDFQKRSRHGNVRPILQRDHRAPAAGDHLNDGADQESYDRGCGKTRERDTKTDREFYQRDPQELGRHIKIKWNTQPFPTFPRSTGGI